jgi:riboflavin kinase/FMN adenylyltransferase
MQLYRTLAALRRPGSHGPRVVTIGVFDGLHIGHRAIIECARSEAEKASLRTLVFTFEPTPKEFFSPATAPPRLTRFRERFELLAALGIDDLFCPSFGAVRQMPHAQFIDSLLVDALGARHVVVGHDFRFGANRLGTVDDLRAAGERRGFGVTEMAPVFWRRERVSSTAIREALKAGDLAAARGLLGRDYCMSGGVVRGLGLGI